MVIFFWIGALWQPRPRWVAAARAVVEAFRKSASSGVGGGGGGREGGVGKCINATAAYIKFRITCAMRKLRRTGLLFVVFLSRCIRTVLLSPPSSSSAQRRR